MRLQWLCLHAFINHHFMIALNFPYRIVDHVCVALFDDFDCIQLRPHSFAIEKATLIWRHCTALNTKSLRVIKLITPNKDNSSCLLKLFTTCWIQNRTDVFPKFTKLEFVWCSVKPLPFDGGMKVTNWGHAPPSVAILYCATLIKVDVCTRPNVISCVKMRFEILTQSFSLVEMLCTVWNVTISFYRWAEPKTFYLCRNGKKVLWSAKKSIFRFALFFTEKT